MRQVEWVDLGTALRGAVDKIRRYFAETLASATTAG